MPSELDAAFEAARSPDAILAAASRLCWAADHDGEACPEARIATTGSFRGFDAGEEAGREFDARMKAILGDRGGRCDWVPGFVRLPAADLRMSDDGALTREGPWRTEETFGAIGLEAPDERDAKPRLAIEPWGLDALHAVWRRDTRRPHPVNPIVRAWQAAPLPVAAEARRDRAIIPRVKVHDRASAAALPAIAPPPPDQPVLPLIYGASPASKRVPLLELVDRSGRPVNARGKGVPLPTRLLVGAYASVPMPQRNRTGAIKPVLLETPLRQIVEALFPNGWRRGQQWPALRQALLTARDYSVHDGRQRWWPLSLVSLPDNPDLDDVVRMTVYLPPHSADGPAVDLPALGELGVSRAHKWRAYIAAHTLNWQPGKTRVPGPGRRYVWTRDPEKYPVLTAKDRRDLAFGAHDEKNRTRAEQDAQWADLPGLTTLTGQTDPDTGETGWRFIPRAASDDGDDDGGGT